MIRLGFDDEGRVSGLPDSFPPASTLTFELIGKDVDLVDTDDSELVLALPAPQRITNGEWTVTFGANSFTVPASDQSAYAIGTGLNRLASIVSAGGVTVSGEDGLVTVAFESVGTRDAISLTHSYLGAMSGRCRTIRAGSVSAKALYELDFTVQTLAKSTTATDIDAADITVTNVATGSSTVQQRDTITITRLPAYGKWQIWSRADLATAFLPPDASSYQVECALEDIEAGEFVVTRHESGGVIKFDLLRSQVGTQTAPTVSDTFIGPAGVTIDLNLSKVGDLLRAAGVDGGIAFLAYTYEGQMRFSEPVKLNPVIVTQPQPI